MSEQISQEDLEAAYKIFLEEKGYHRELADYKRATKELIKANTETTRINYRNVVSDLNQKLQKEIQAEQERGNFNDTATRIGKKLGSQKQELEAFEKTYGYRPKEDLDSAYQRELARENFRNRPNTENASLLMPTPNDLARETQMKKKQNYNDLMAGLNQAAEEANKTAEERFQKAEDLEKARLAKEAEWNKVRGDPRFGNPKNNKLPPSPREVQMERERILGRTVADEFKQAGYNYDF